MAPSFFSFRRRSGTFVTLASFEGDLAKLNVSSPHLGLGIVSKRDCDRSIAVRQLQCFTLLLHTQLSNCETSLVHISPISKQALGQNEDIVKEENATVLLDVVGELGRAAADQNPILPPVAMEETRAGQDVGDVSHQLLVRFDQGRVCFEVLQGHKLPSEGEGLVAGGPTVKGLLRRQLLVDDVDESLHHAHLLHRLLPFLSHIHFWQQDIEYSLDR